MSNPNPDAPRTRMKLVHPTVQAAKWAFFGAVLGALINALVPVLIGLSQRPLPTQQEVFERAAEDQSLAPPVEDKTQAATVDPLAMSTGAEKRFRAISVGDQKDARVSFQDKTESVAIVEDGRYLISVHATMNYDQGGIHPYFKCIVRQDSQDGKSKSVGGDYTFGVSCGTVFTAELKKGDLLGVIVGQASGLPRRVSGSFHVVKVPR